MPTQSKTLTPIDAKHFVTNIEALIGGEKLIANKSGNPVDYDKILQWAIKYLSLHATEELNAARKEGAELGWNACNKKAAHYIKLHKGEISEDEYDAIPAQRKFLSSLPPSEPMIPVSKVTEMLQQLQDKFNNAKMVGAATSVNVLIGNIKSSYE